VSSWIFESLFSYAETEVNADPESFQLIVSDAPSASTVANWFGMSHCPSW
jgi:hypothetical protein